MKPVDEAALEAALTRDSIRRQRTVAIIVAALCALGLAAFWVLVWPAVANEQVNAWGMVRFAWWAIVLAVVLLRQIALIVSLTRSLRRT